MQENPCNNWLHQEEGIPHLWSFICIINQTLSILGMEEVIIRVIRICEHTSLHSIFFPPKIQFLNVKMMFHCYLKFERRRVHTYYCPRVPGSPHMSSAAKVFNCQLFTQLSGLSSNPPASLCFPNPPSSPHFTLCSMKNSQHSGIPFRGFLNYNYVVRITEICN